MGHGGWCPIVLPHRGIFLVFSFFFILSWEGVGRVWEGVGRPWEGVEMALEVRYGEKREKRKGTDVYSLIRSSGCSFIQLVIQSFIPYIHYFVQLRKLSQALGGSETIARDLEACMREGLCYGISWLWEELRGWGWSKRRWGVVRAHWWSGYRKPLVQESTYINIGCQRHNLSSVGANAGVAVPPYGPLYGHMQLFSTQFSNKF